MAKTNTPNPSPVSGVPAGAIVQTQATIDSTLANAGPQKESPSSAFEAQIQAFVNGNASALSAKLDAVVKAKPEAFVEAEKDFWKPAKAGDSLTGVYLASAKVGRLTQHAIAVQSKEDPKKSVIMRLNGQHILTRELTKIAPGSGVKITYNGESKTMDGQKLGTWTVQRMQG